ncbi:MAG: type 2 lanthipeptide synthetase LanM family protein [Acidobacteriota bacterium]|nr:type 2 lanthipeptide synthetase LanM family protein [Acidobacteriota bacterium]
MQLDARARTLDERLAAGVRSPVRAGDASGPGGRNAAILDFWAIAFAGGNPDALARRLAWDGLTPADVVEAAASLQGLADAPWVRFLDEALALARENKTEAEPAELAAFPTPAAFSEFWIPFVRAARARAARIERIEDGLFASAALRTLEGELLSDLASIGERVLSERVGFVHQANAPLSDDDPLVLFVEFPVLARLASTLAMDWVTATCELLSRVRTDRAALAEAFGASGPVTAVKAGISDRHRGGRRVVILKFQSGARVVYKPRTVGLEAEWNKFLTWLGAAGAPDAPPALRFVVRDGYGWAEFAAPVPMRDEAAVEAYFRSAGGLLAAAWLLGARDFHMDNVVATGAGPVVVDAEAIFQPDAVIAPLQGVFDVANALLDASFLPTGLLMLGQADGEGRISDVGGLNGGGEGSANLPVLGGVSLRAEDRPAAVLQGFASTYRFLLSRRTELEARGGPLSGFGVHRLRVVFRPSEIYARLLSVLAAPRYLREGWVRSVALDALNRPFSAGADPPALWPLARDERAALERMDIPCFDLGALETNPVSGAGVVVSRHFARSGFEALAVRLSLMDDANLAAQVRLLTAFLSRGVSSRAPAVDAAAAAVPESSARESPEALTAEAVRLADGILRDAVAGEDGALLWIDPAAVRAGDRRERGSSYYLYDGGAGILLFFAAAVAATGYERFSDAARCVALPIRRIFDAPNLQTLLASEGLGVCSGAGSLVYALAVAATLLGEEWPLVLAGRAAALITSERIAADTTYDLEAGSAGAILGLLALHAATGDPGALRSAVVCGEHLVARRLDLGDGAWGWPSEHGLFLGGLAHGTSGIALAFVRLAAAASRDDFLDAARAAYRHEATLFDPATGNWPALVNDGGSVRRLDMKAWCHGAPGIVLSRLGTRGLLDASFDRDFEVSLDIALETTRCAGLLSLDHACCGNIGLVEALAAAGEALARPELALAAEARLEAMLRRARLLGGFRLRGTEEENAGVLPGFFRGQAGIGYTLLRRARPGLLPNVLAFEANGASRPNRRTHE